MPTSKSPTPRRRRLRIRKPSLATVLWACTSLVLTILFLLVQGALFLTVMLLSMLVTTISAFADFTGDQPPGSGPAAPKPRAASTSGNTRKATRSRSRSATGRKRVCSARCRNSTKSVATCECVCGGRTHGKRGAATAAPARPVQPVGEPMKRVS